MPDKNGIPNPHHDVDAWIKWRRRKIGGNAAATIAGVNKYQTIGQLFDLIVHGIQDQRSAEDEAFLSWRLSLERNIADRYAEETGRTIRRCGSVSFGPDDRIVCSPDREIIKNTKGVGLLEIKSRDPIIWNQIKLTGPPGADWVQTQHYLMVRDLKWGAICEANVSTGKQIRVDIEADPEFHKVLLGKIGEFLTACEQKKRPAEAIADPVRLPVVGGELVVSDMMDDKLANEFRSIVEGVNQSHDLRKRANDYYDSMKKAAQSWMEGNRFDVVEGFGSRIYNREQAGRKTLDKKALMRDNPGLDLSLYEKQGAPFRRFVVYDRPLAIESKTEG